MLAGNFHADSYLVIYVADPRDSDILFLRILPTQSAELLSAASSAFTMAPTKLKVVTRSPAAKPLLQTPTAHMATTTLKVGGMTCGACTSAVEAGFKGVDGIGNASVSLVMERAVVIHDPQKIAAEKIQEIIEDRGFDAEILATDLPSPMFDRRGYLYDEDEDGEEEEKLFTTTVLAVEGMTCGACT